MQNHLSKTIIFSCYLASFLEIYDFMIFGFFASILHKNYLSFLSEDSALLITYVLFAVGFVFRPLGSLIFGYIGDIYGRKKALVLSVSFMGIASLGMCLLPPYSMIGGAACFIIALIRIIQGISVGGEFMGALIYAIEHNRGKDAGLIGGIVSAGGATGILLATIVSSFLNNPNLPDYSWRLAFLLGFGLTIVGYIIRSKLSETPVFTSISGKKLKLPLIEGFKQYKTECLATICTAAANGISFYFVVIYLPNFLKKAVSYNLDFLSTFVVLILIIFTPIWGLISDKINRQSLLLVITGLMIVYSIFAINLMVGADNVFILTFYITIYAILVAGLVATVNVFAIEIFPAKARMSCSSLFYSLGMGWIGGTLPMVATFLVQWLGEDQIYLSIYIAIVSALAFITTKLVKNKKGTEYLN